jgi:hypothetical protein
MPVPIAPKSTKRDERSWTMTVPLTISPVFGGLIEATGATLLLGVSLIIIETLQHSALFFKGFVVEKTNGGF